MNLAHYIEGKKQNEIDTILRYDKLTEGNLYIHIIGQAPGMSRFFQSRFSLAVLASPGFD